MDARRTLNDLRPVRLAEWVELDGIVVVACPRPKGRGWREIPTWFRWWTGPQRLRLDAVGSAAWRLFDGKATLAMVVEVLEGDLDDGSTEAMQDRIELFVRVLLRENLIELRMAG